MTDSLTLLKFDNRFIEQLPEDPIKENTCRMVTDACYSHVWPRLASSPKLIGLSAEVAELLNIEIADCHSEEFKNIFTGNQLLPDMVPYASCYGGHQFGHWAGQLGDGRAINLGEIINQQQQRWALQLKGAGPTPYSRHSDGLAVLRSSLREFLCSEAMFHLAVPTTRALSLCLTGDTVRRDMFYDGNAIDELGAVVCRVAPSFTRFGHFQILASQGNNTLLKQFLDFTIETDFPHLGKPSESVYQQWFAEVCQLTKTMVLHWMRVGFVHGVMNTDNMSILGLTIDYGPYGWLEGYDQGWTPNTTDAEGKRYCFGRQPIIAHWNLAQLSQAISPLIEDTDALKLSLDQFCDDYQRDWHCMMLDKLGLSISDPDCSELDKSEQTDDISLITELLKILQLTETDMTIFYRRLAKLDTVKLAATSIEQIPEPLLEAYYQPQLLQGEVLSEICDWLSLYVKRCALGVNTPDEAARRKQVMNQTNPKYVLRNYLAQQAIDKAEAGDYSMIEELLDVMRKPYDEQPAKETFAMKRPEWARHKAGCSMLSCSS
ncbi:MAG: YdiU family protein [Gammaproteobacteria bacterium]|nr:MAG: YdiU family protein [Gammaproteobacteria bacterium]